MAGNEMHDSIYKGTENPPHDDHALRVWSAAFSASFAFAMTVSAPVLPTSRRCFGVDAQVIYSILRDTTLSRLPCTDAMICYLDLAANSTDLS